MAQRQHQFPTEPFNAPRQLVVRINHLMSQRTFCYLRTVAECSSPLNNRIKGCILGGIDDLYLAVSARHIQFPEWAFFWPGDCDDPRSWDRALVWNCNVRPVKVLSLLDD
jgi:hypothetical protein